MSYFVARLTRPYDFRVLIEVSVHTRRKNYVHPDFLVYYNGLLQALQRAFDIQLKPEGLVFRQRILWGLFENTVLSLLQITSPWSGYLEAGLVLKKLDESGVNGQEVHRASAIIGKSNTDSEAAHRDMLYALFVAIYGECNKVLTSEELLLAGFDDSKEPDIKDYYDYM